MWTLLHSVLLDQWSPTVVEELEGQGGQAHPQKFWFVENSGKIPKN